MKIRVTYALVPPLHIASGVHVVTALGEITVPEQDGFANKLSVSIFERSRELVPSVTANPTPGVAANVDISPEVHKRTLQIARTFVATLGTLGFRARVETFPTQYEWERENQSELASPIETFNIERRHREVGRPARVDQLIHSAASIGRMTAWVDVLEFNNAGHDNFLAERYADALRYHFLVLESLYGRGKSTPKKLVAELLGHPRVVVATRSSIRFPCNYVVGKDELEKYRQCFNAASAEAALLRLANARGLISHHNIRSPKRWTVANQSEFKLEATLLANIAHRLISKIARHEMWSPDVVAACGGYRD